MLLLNVSKLNQALVIYTWTGWFGSEISDFNEILTNPKEAKNRIICIFILK